MFLFIQKKNCVLHEVNTAGNSVEAFEEELERQIRNINVEAIAEFALCPNGIRYGFVFTINPRVCRS